jgi:3-hydroxyacyl-[acyl-carrier-protein] dehydratase
MRFLFYDRILEMELGKRAVATKAISIGDEFLWEHYSRRPIMPPTLVLECMTQVGGWLYIATKEFSISIVLALLQGVKVHGHARPGDTIRIETWLNYEHREGATMRAEAQVDGRPVMSAERLVFACRPLKEPDHIRRSREMFGYLSGGYELNEGVRQ